MLRPTNNHKVRIVLVLLSALCGRGQTVVGQDESPRLQDLTPAELRDLQEKYHASIDPPALVEAARKGNLSEVESWLKKGAAVDAEDPRDGSTALMAACRGGRLDIARVLTSNGADVNHVSRLQGETPLMLATESGHVEAVRFLIKAGANVNIRDIRGGSALTRALLVHRKAIEEVLVEHGARVPDVPSIPTWEDLTFCIKELNAVSVAASDWLSKNLALYKKGYQPRWEDIGSHIVARGLPSAVNGGHDVLGNSIVLSSFGSGRRLVTVSTNTIERFQHLTGDVKKTCEVWGNYYPYPLHKRR